MASNDPYKKRAYTGLTILENVKQYLPEDISRDDIKGMLYNSLGDTVVNDSSQYIKGKNLTKDQVEGIIDMLMKSVKKEEGEEEENPVEDERLKDVKVKIGFYDADKENVREIIFRGKNPTDEELDQMLNQLTSNGEENVKLLAVEFED